MTASDDDAEDATPYESLEALTVDLVLRAPFFGHVLAGIEKRLAVGATTLVASRAKVVLEVSEASLRGPRPEARGVMKHELLHLLLEHPLRRAELADAPRFDLASDLVVGPLLEPAERGALDPMPEQFPELPREASAERYYALLPPTPARGALDPRDAAASRAASRAGDTEGEAGEAGEDDTPGAPRSHDRWQTFEGGTATERALRGAFVRRLAEDAYEKARRKAHGRVPAGLLRALAESLERGAALDWRVALRRFRATSELTTRVSTIHRPSKRYGTVPGAKSRRRCRLVAVVDTSGSVTDEELASFGHELRHLARAGADLRVIACDSVVHSDEPFRGGLTHLAGGGGTSLDAGLRAADAHGPDGIVYLTDGLVAQVNVRPRAPVLWLLTPGGLDPSAPATALLLRGRRARLR